MVEIATIPEFYRNKTIFITGGSGFIGKVLVEKLLRSCPDLKTIYLLLREKKGQAPEDRIKTITDLPLFDVLKSKTRDSLNKIKIVVGDVRELDLGLNLHERQLLIDEVNVVFHVAASVRFDDSLTDAVIMNTRGTREVAKLALEMKNLDVFVHISTTYCNSDRKVVEERLYPAVADWEKTIEIVENIDRHTLNVLTEKYIHPKPNTYTFAKSLGEQVVYDMCNGKIPVVVYRPSVVIPTNLEPITGWVDNFNGPMGVLVGYGKGLVRIMYSDPNNIMDSVPVDITVKMIIISSWKQATYKDTNEKLTASFYNGSNNSLKNVNLETLFDIGRKIWNEHPFDNVLWYPDCKITKCYYNYIFQMIIYQLVPALLIDGMLKLIGERPMLTKLQRKIHTASIALAHFTHNNWTFVNDKFYRLKYELLPADVDSFSFDEDDTVIYTYVFNSVVEKIDLKLNDDCEDLVLQDLEEGDVIPPTSTIDVPIDPMIEDNRQEIQDSDQRAASEEEGSENEHFDQEEAASTRRVVPSASEPITGWVDNFNGLVGFMVGCGKGLMRIIYSDPNNIVDSLPVDITVKAIIISSWKQATYKDANQKLTASFYNGSNNGVKNINVETIMNTGKEIWNEFPFDNVLWYPGPKITKCYYNYFFQMVIYQLVPALLVDGVLKLIGERPMLTRLQRKIHTATVALAYFTHNNWTFVNDKCFHLKYELLPADVDSFSFKEEDTRIDSYIFNCFVGGKKYLLTESDDVDKRRNTC
ncbi:hypothetical protein Zmor_003907 [Zophobas morio]|uniref:Fatty acyl-CoA reductase n=1 Tax=Zophobas morio TaxID=2755281 RepID=A0AA38HMK7_9CUCU|nr:hypothetical protein Zmor_003907 [Zophobas morio]